jgi:hypothetical protein
MPSLIDTILDDTGPTGTPAPNPVTTPASTPGTTTAGTPKTFSTGVKGISITGPATIRVGTSAIYKVSGSLGYSSWVGQDPTLKIYFVLYTIASGGSLTLSNNLTSPNDTYTFTPTTAGTYQLVAYAQKTSECDDAVTCPRVSINILVTSPTPTPTPTSTTIVSSPGCPNPTEITRYGTKTLNGVSLGDTITVPYTLNGNTCVQSCPPGFTKPPGLPHLCQMILENGTDTYIYTEDLKTAPYTGGSTTPPASTSTPPTSTSTPPSSTNPPAPTNPPPASTGTPPATLSTDDFKTLNTNLKTVNSKLNSLYNQIQGLGRTTAGMNTQLTSIEGVTNKVNTMINTLVTSLQNTPTEELPLQEGGYRRTSRRNKTKHNSTFRKKPSKL